MVQILGPESYPPEVIRKGDLQESPSEWHMDIHHNTLRLVMVVRRVLDQHPDQDQERDKAMVNLLGRILMDHPGMTKVMHKIMMVSVL
jgi:hypothetical protein